MSSGHYAWQKVIDNGGRANATAFHESQPGRALLMGDVWGIHETLDNMRTFLPRMDGAGGLMDVYGRTAAYSLANPAVGYVGTGTLKAAHGTFSSVNGFTFTRLNTTVAAFGTSLAPGAAAQMPRAGCGTLLDVSWVGGVETILALTPVGLERSTNGGRTWQTLMAKPTGLTWKALARLDTSHALVASYMNATSQGGSQVWLVSGVDAAVATFQKIAAPAVVNDFARRAATPGLLAACGPYGLQVASAGGFKPFAASTFQGLVVDTVDAVGDTIYASCKGAKSVACSHDAGKSWAWSKFSAQILGSTRQWWLAPLSMQPGGASFKPNHISVDPGNPESYLLAATGGGYGSDDGGVTLHPVGYAGGDEVNGLRLGPGANEIWGTDTDWTGIHSTDGGATWQRTKSPGTCPAGLTVSAGGATFAVTKSAGGRITRNGVEISDAYARSAICPRANAIRVDAAGNIYVALYGGVLKGTPTA